MVVIPTVPHLVWSARTTSSRPAATNARSASASSRLGVVNPASSPMPCTPRNTWSRCSDASDETAMGRPARRYGVRVPPVSMTCGRARSTRCSTSAMRIEFVTTVRPGSSRSRSRTSRSSYPPRARPRSPAAPAARPSSAIASFSGRLASLASKPGSSVLSARCGRAAVHLVERPREESTRGRAGSSSPRRSGVATARSPWPPRGPAPPRGCEPGARQPTSGLLAPRACSTAAMSGSCADASHHGTVRTCPPAP